MLRLIFDIQQREFNTGLTETDQPDLQDVQASYRAGGGEFWVAVPPWPTHQDRIVGCIGVQRITHHTGALRKLFVAPHQRGTGLARALTDVLFAWARAERMTDIYLGTAPMFHAAHRFYEREGFARMDEARLPLGFPRMAIDTRFYHYHLTSHLPPSP
ncbi:GNAT family N-acetyltransferase [Corticibacter populi]|uniref:GNAT family N-acetyltransferase n=1 Tax=Corticibacter populi TaxID=1550736 RepID=UPI0013EE7C35|nr:GNAT family N-acetyltransferase [Corticibacter populi]